MNKYTGLSDFEINKRVFVAAKIEHEDTDLHSNKVFYGDGANWIEFNPCNNPADAMPIIIENKLTLSPRYDSDEWISESLFYHDIYSVNKNPLRAAMEVFLMMKDAENEG
ncbi:phage protein NinX family protein [Providencia hangzhouensis]|uniref:phage protein NinX family protein n=1 Tax=Providencia hangzhouensis TaxID=3031799 RepID=UPI0034DDC564